MIEYDRTRAQNPTKQKNRTKYLPKLRAKRQQTMQRLAQAVNARMPNGSEVKGKNKLIASWPKPATTEKVPETVPAI